MCAVHEQLGLFLTSLYTGGPEEMRPLSCFARGKAGLTMMMGPASIDGKESFSPEPTLFVEVNIDYTQCTPHTHQRLALRVSHVNHALPCLRLRRIPTLRASTARMGGSSLCRLAG